jgi:hypothetical protein
MLRVRCVGAAVPACCAARHSQADWDQLPGSERQLLARVRPAVLCFGAAGGVTCCCAVLLLGRRAVLCCCMAWRVGVPPPALPFAVQVRVCLCACVQRC